MSSESWTRDTTGLITACQIACESFGSFISSFLHCHLVSFFLAAFPVFWAAKQGNMLHLWVVEIRRERLHSSCVVMLALLHIWYLSACFSALPDGHESGLPGPKVLNWSRHTVKIVAAFHWAVYSLGTSLLFPDI